ncbi:unnamed protein product [marine sediment metagenome]|uniref:Uncharacterized protein n=1 Tax=marine sediment metagenome TaxID=412755 RepID=X1I3H8_9ZZZZ
MKQLLALAGCAIILSTIAGCQNADKGVDVIVEGDSQFPQFLVGTWKENKFGWEFVFQPDGTISSAVIDGGKIRVNPARKIAATSLKGWGDAVYELGQWMVQYSPQNRELAVQVVVEHFSLKVGAQGLEGHSTDWFVGPVSADSKTWDTEWYTSRTNIFLTPERTELRHDPNDNPVEFLIFRKQSKTN